MDDSPLNADQMPTDDVDAALRPTRLEDFAGQDDATSQLSVTLRAARSRGTQAPHLLFHGPPGLGKTTLAQIVANEMGVGDRFKATSAPAFEKPGDVVALLTSREPGDVVFIDEIHRMNRLLQEVLYPAMEDFVVDIVVGDGPQAKMYRLDLPPFTLVGATTRAGALAGPLRDRFGLALPLELYDVDTLTGIIRRSAGLLGVDITEDAACLLASRSRGTPRIANRLLDRVRDFALVEGDGRIDTGAAEAAMALFKVDAIGLDTISRRVLDVLTGSHAGRAVGLKVLATIVGEAVDTIEESVEPFLVRSRLVDRTPRGRVAMPAAYEHMGREQPHDGAAQLRIA